MTPKTSSEERVARQPKMNVKLLRRIQKHILADPRRLNMHGWGVAGLDTSLRGNPPCGTVGCIAGWAIFLTDKPVVGVLTAVAFNFLVVAAFSTVAVGVKFVWVLIH